MSKIINIGDYTTAKATAKEKMEKWYEMNKFRLSDALGPCCGGLLIISQLNVFHLRKMKKGQRP